MTATRSGLPPTVLLVDDHELIRGGLRQALESTGAFQVVGEAGTVAETLRLTEKLRPDVVVLDISLPDGSGLAIVGQLRAAHPQMGIVILTMSDSDGPLFLALESKASAFVLKSAPMDQVVAAVHHAATAPHGFTSANLVAALQRRMTVSPPALSPREQQLLLLLSEGLTLAAIGKTMFLSPSTTKGYTSRLYVKLGAANRAQALVAAIRAGLLTVDAGGDQRPPPTGAERR